jgi:hypothetical protein
VVAEASGVTTGSGSGGVGPHAQASAAEFSLIDAGSETLTFLEYVLKWPEIAAAFYYPRHLILAGPN